MVGINTGRIGTSQNLLPVLIFSVFFSLGAIALINPVISTLFITVHQWAALLLLLYYVYLDAEGRGSTDPTFWVTLMVFLMLLLPSVAFILISQVGQLISQIDQVLLFIPYLIPPALYVVFRGEKESDKHDHELPALKLLIALASSFILVNMILRYEVFGTVWTTTNYVTIMLVLLVLTYALSYWLVNTHVEKRAGAG